MTDEADRGVAELEQRLSQLDIYSIPRELAERWDALATDTVIPLEATKADIENLSAALASTTESQMALMTMMTAAMGKDTGVITERAVAFAQKIVAAQTARARFMEGIMRTAVKDGFRG